MSEEEEETDSGDFDSESDEDEDSELDGFKAITELDERRKSIRQIREFEKRVQDKEQCNLPLPNNPISHVPSPRTRRREFQKRVESQSTISVNSTRSPGPDRMLEVRNSMSPERSDLLQPTCSHGSSMSKLPVPRHSGGDMRSIRLPPWFRVENGFDKDRQDDILNFMREGGGGPGGPAGLLEGLTKKFKLNADQAKSLLNVQLHMSNSTIMTSTSSMMEPQMEPSPDIQPRWTQGNSANSADRAGDDEKGSPGVTVITQKARSVAYDPAPYARPSWGDSVSQPVRRAALSQPEPYRAFSNKSSDVALPPALSPGIQHSCSTSYLGEKSPYSSMSSLPNVEGGIGGISLRQPRKRPVPITKTSSKRKTVGQTTKLYINQYLIKEKIGAGSFGNVRRCTDITTGGEYAMKIINKPKLEKQLNFFSMEATDGDEPLEKIWEEIAIMKKLNHQNIVNLIEVIDSKQTLYMILEYMKDGSVAKGSKQIESVIRDGHEKEDMETLRFWIRDIASGLAYLHANKIIHSDIKPENILIGQNGELKLADFGTSLMFTGKSSRILEITGTHAFMAPETIKEVSGEKFHAYPVDVWALGVTLYQLRYGKLPFDGNGVVELYDAIENDPLIIPKDEEETLADVLKRLMDKDPKTRIKMADLCKHPWITNKGMHECVLHDYDGVHATEYEVSHAINKHRKLGDQFSGLSSSRSIMQSMGTSTSSLGDWDNDKDQFYELAPSGRPRSGTDCDDMRSTNSLGSGKVNTGPGHRKHHSGDLMLVHRSSLDQGLLSSNLKEADHSKGLPRSATDISDRKSISQLTRNRLQIHKLADPGLDEALPDNPLRLDHRDTGPGTPTHRPDLAPPADSNNTRQSVRVPPGGGQGVNLLQPTSGLERASRADPRRLNLPKSGLTLDDDESITMPSPHGERKPKARSVGTKHRGSVRFATTAEALGGDEAPRARRFISPPKSKGILKKRNQPAFGGLSPNEEDRELGFSSNDEFSESAGLSPKSTLSEPPLLLGSSRPTQRASPGSIMAADLPSATRTTVTVEDATRAERQASDPPIVVVGPGRPEKTISETSRSGDSLAISETPPTAPSRVQEALLAATPENRRGSLLGRMMGRLRRK